MIKIKYMLWTPEIQDELDFQFIQRIQNEVTQSCALPFTVPTERIPEIMVQAAQWMWTHLDDACEERWFAIPYEEICTKNPLNKIVQLPSQIMSVWGCHKVRSRTWFGYAGDFSLERILLSQSNGVSGGIGVTGAGYGAGVNLMDVVTSLYEIDTFNTILNAPVTYNFNEFSSKLVLLGDLKGSDIVIQTQTRCRIQDLYNSYHFFRLCVCFVKKALSTIYGTYEFKLPGGVTINYSNFSDEANEELDKIYEWAENQRANHYFFVSGSV